MDFKPQTFFIGVIDFFSVLLPGAMLTWFFKIMYFDEWVEKYKINIVPDTDSGKWIAFLVITYIIGNIIFMIASFQDDFYDKFLRKYFKKNFDLSVKTANTIQNKFIDTDTEILKLYKENKLRSKEVKEIFERGNKRYIFNTYKWSQYYLLFNNPEALYEVKRIEADSKFFRSLVLTFLIFAVVLIIESELLFGSLLFLLSIGCLYRFAELRYKSTSQAYESVITHYYLQHKSDSVIDNVITSSIIKTEIQQDFINKYDGKIKTLLSGFVKEPKHVILNTAEFTDTIFNSENSECWYCMEGKGIMIVNNGDAEQKHFLSTNAIIPILKGSTFLFRNIQSGNIQFLVFNN